MEINPVQKVVHSSFTTLLKELHDRLGFTTRMFGKFAENMDNYEFEVSLISLWADEGERGVSMSGSELQPTILNACRAFKKENNRSDVQVRCCVYAIIDPKHERFRVELPEHLWKEYFDITRIVNNKVTMKTRTTVIVGIEHEGSLDSDAVAAIIKEKLIAFYDTRNDITAISVLPSSSQKIYPPDPPEYKKWRTELSEIATKQYNDPFGQDPTSKGDEDFYREGFYAGKSPAETLRR